LAQLSGITSNQLEVVTWQLATKLKGGNAALATNVVSGINITNAFIANSIFAGNGAGLTNFNATNLVGTIPNGRLSTNVALLNGTNLFTGTNHFAGVTILTNGNNIVNGTFAGNGGGLTNVNAAALGGIGPTSVWQLGGNNVAPGQFLGSTNTQPLELWVNNGRALRLEANPGGAPNVIGGSPNNTAQGAIGVFIGGGGVTNYFGGSESVQNATP